VSLDGIPGRRRNLDGHIASRHHRLGATLTGISRVHNTGDFLAAMDCQKKGLVMRRVSFLAVLGILCYVLLPGLGIPRRRGQVARSRARDLPPHPWSRRAPGPGPAWCLGPSRGHLGPRNTGARPAGPVPIAGRLRPVDQERSSASAAGQRRCEDRRQRPYQRATWCLGRPQLQRAERPQLRQPQRFPGHPARPGAVRRPRRHAGRRPLRPTTPRST